MFCILEIKAWQQIDPETNTLCKEKTMNQCIWYDTKGDHSAHQIHAYRLFPLVQCPPMLRGSVQKPQTSGAVSPPVPEFSVELGTVRQQHKFVCHQIAINCFIPNCCGVVVIAKCKVK